MHLIEGCGRQTQAAALGVDLHIHEATPVFQDRCAFKTIIRGATFAKWLRHRRQPQTPHDGRHAEALHEQSKDNETKDGRGNYFVAGQLRGQT